MIDATQQNPQPLAVTQAHEAVAAADAALEKAKQDAVTARERARDATFEWLAEGQTDPRGFNLTATQALTMVSVSLEPIAYVWDRGDDLTDEALQALTSGQNILESLDQSDMSEDEQDHLNDLLDMIGEMTAVFC